MQTPTIYIFGEVLYDLFQDGSAILGGAPFNVAWHLQGLGLSPKMLTCVGEDTLGWQITETMTRWGMDTTHVTTAPDKKTGVVNVTLDSRGIPQYTIEDDVAYDHISTTELPNHPALFYHGSLALRHEYNQNRCLHLKQIPQTQTFVDINLREPWWDAKTLQHLLKHSDWLKLNHEELPLVSSSLGFKSSDTQEQVAFLIKKLTLKMLILTRGDKGAVLFEPSGTLFEVQAHAPESIEDTVGAGDAFSAIILYGIHQNWKTEFTLKRAASFASKVCAIKGATIEDKAFYSNTLREWENDR